MQKSNIEWCDSTWNPVTGCKHGCEYCYAQRIATRFGGYDGSDRSITTRNPLPRAELHQPLTITRQNGKTVNSPFPFGFEPTLHHYRLGEPQQARKPQTIFVCSMADLFGAWVPIRWIVEVLDACEAAPQHRYMFLTKNPERYAQLDRLALLPRRDNFWYGSTITSKESRRFNGTISLNTFLSIEPLHEYLDVGLGSFGGDRLIIIGAETGNRAGKITPEKAWVDNICEAADLTQAAVFMKDSLRPIVGKANMRRELPWEKGEQQA
ncbi:MAG: phage Gp37/Gp68 family protein [Acutalibacter sp.]|nr:phage Gp37/Gp68 family protein [Acutalibacter sp.]